MVGWGSNAGSVVLSASCDPDPVRRLPLVLATALAAIALVGMTPGANTWGLCLRHHVGGWRVSSEGVG